jgi:hypothetical protein
MDSQGTTRLTFYLLISIRQPSSARGKLFSMGNYHLALKMLVKNSSGPCHMISTISNILQNLTSTIYLPTHPSRSDHLGHLRAIFLQCRFYRIHLNPHKCIFIVESGQLLGFVVSKDGIRVDPLNIKDILSLPPPNNLNQLQSL